MRTRIDGLLIVDKPKRVSSFGVVKEIKHRFGLKKVGHIGTLDPFATGVLPIALNEGTKLVPFLMEEPKEYEAILKLGEETTTEDLTGEVINQNSWEGIKQEEILSVFQHFLGKIKQKPPMFSAIKLKGKPLYQLARKGMEVEREERVVEIFNLQVQEINLPFVRFYVSCSKGTYIRTLAKDIGQRLGCGAHLISLRRTRSGTFTLEQAVSWEELKKINYIEELRPWLISLTEALPTLPEVVVEEKIAQQVRFGQEVTSSDLSIQNLPFLQEGGWVKMSSQARGLVAILKAEKWRKAKEEKDSKTFTFRPLRIFHFGEKYA